MKTRVKDYQAALYMRLSKDDGLSESASISTQRKMLRTYARENGYDVFSEYVDDGWSGTNFERPGWKRLLCDIESKKVNLVITKDLSRMGRDYITAGQYTEIYFPSKGVRYIAVNDGYDSESPYTDIAPFKNVINEMYARDTSKKIRSAFRTKMEEGAFIGNFAPYGYIKDPADKNHLLIDPAVAPVIQEIFRMAEDGGSPSEIARALNLGGILTPAMYRCCRRPYLNADDYSRRREWTSSMICKMLRNIVYLGHVAQGKTTKVSFKSSLTLQNPREEWIIAENMHEALITKETFDNVRRRSVSRRQPPKTDFTNIFSGIAICADCGRNMSTTGSRRNGGGYDLVCGGYKQYGRDECANHFIDYDVLYDVVLLEIKKLLALTREAEAEMIEALINETMPKEKPTVSDALTALEKRAGELDRIIEHLYEDYAGGRLEDVRFYKLLASYEAEQKDISVRLDSLVKPAEPEGERTERELYRAFLVLTQDNAEVTELTPSLLRILIDRIEVCQGSFDRVQSSGRKHQTVRIYYKFSEQPEKTD